MGATTARPPILLEKICARHREKYIGSIVRYYLENWHLTRVISIVYQSTSCKYISCYIYNAHLWFCHYWNILVAWSKKRLSFHLTVDVIKIFGDQMNVPVDASVIFWIRLLLMYILANVSIWKAKWRFPNGFFGYFFTGLNRIDWIWRLLLNVHSVHVPVSLIYRLTYNDQFW